MLIFDIRLFVCPLPCYLVKFYWLHPYGFSQLLFSLQLWLSLTCGVWRRLIARNITLLIHQLPQRLRLTMILKVLSFHSVIARHRQVCVIHLFFVRATSWTHSLSFIHCPTLLNTFSNAFHLQGLFSMSKEILITDLIRGEICKRDIHIVLSFILSDRILTIDSSVGFNYWKLTCFHFALFIAFEADLLFFNIYAHNFICSVHIKVKQSFSWFTYSVRPISSLFYHYQTSQWCICSYNWLIDARCQLFTVMTQFTL